MPRTKAKVEELSLHDIIERRLRTWYEVRTEAGHIRRFVRVAHARPLGDVYRIRLRRHGVERLPIPPGVKVWQAQHASRMRPLGAPAQAS